MFVFHEFFFEKIWIVFNLFFKRYLFVIKLLFLFIFCFVYLFCHFLIKKISFFCRVFFITYRENKSCVFFVKHTLTLCFIVNVVLSNFSFESIYVFRFVIFFPKICSFAKNIIYSMHQTSSKNSFQKCYKNSNMEKCICWQIVRYICVFVNNVYRKINILLI